MKTYFVGYNSAVQFAKHFPVTGVCWIQIIHNDVQCKESNKKSIKSKEGMV